MSVINTNITAMIGQQNLGKSQSALQTSMERLSSGLRINSAADDAAGQAIANRMTAQTTGLAQAQRNANDGISVAQTAEGALNQVNDNLQRIRELTVQAENGTNSAEDLSSIQDEIGQRLGEINRISEETNFNGVKVLAQDQELSIQVGANDGEKITMNLKEMTASTLGLDTFNVAPGINTDDVGTTSVSSKAATTIDDSSFDASALGTGGGSLGSVQVDGDGNYFAELTGDSTPAANGYYEVTVASDGTATLGSLASSQPTAGDLSAATDMGDGVTFTGDDVDAGNLYEYSGTESDAPAYVIQDTDTDGNTVYFEANIDSDGAVTRGGQLSDAPATANPLEALDGALSQVDSLRSELGAMQNRFDSAITNLSTTETNLSAARSRIEDADYAVEVSNMTRAQILQQAGTSVLAQANQVPQSVLSLLG
ncbi:MAG TPA: flagellin FliC [Alcanivorax sp.]|jgi:flagellin|nr:flagellin FliC [Alcanivorax sp.]HBY49368.1 flagellin FliC [Alcanivorax sp.]|tara:strand:+ start:1844 stop:3124 length:1281 start_codon:yes stop_codon:yes gene_type:complete